MKLTIEDMLSRSTTKPMSPFSKQKESDVSSTAKTSAGLNSFHSKNAPSGISGGPMMICDSDFLVNSHRSSNFYGSSKQQNASKF